MRARRRRSPIGIDIWPGFVDALASLLMVVIFLLMVFALAQHFLNDALSGRDEALAAATARADAAEAERDQTRTEAAALNQALIKTKDGLERVAADVTERAEQAAALEDALAAAIKQASKTLTRLERTEAKLSQALTAGEASADKAQIEAQRADAAEANAAELSAILAAKAAENDKQAIALSTSAASIASLEAALSALRRSTAALEATLVKKTGENSQQLEDLARAQAKNQALSIDLTALERRISKLQGEVSNSQAQAKTTEAALKAERAAAQRQLGASEGRRAALQEQVAALSKALEAARREGESAASAKEAISARLAERSAANAEAIADYRARIETLEAEISNLNARARALQEAADAAETGLIAARKAAIGLEAERGQVIDERKRIAALNAELQTKLDQLNAALDAALADAKARGATILQLRGKLNAALAAKVGELKRYRSDFFARLSEALGERDDIRVVGDRFVLQSEVLFATAKAELGPQGQASIKAVARSLNDIVRTIPADVDWVLRVDGHTDQRPIANEQFPSNWELSTARAVAVVRALADAGIPANRLAAAGFGQHHPIDRASSAAADRRNRRIEFKLTTR